MIPLIHHSPFVSILFILSIPVNFSASERDAHRLHDLAQDFLGLLAAAVERRGEARVDDEAVREDRKDEPLDVVGQAVVAPLREGEGLRRSEEHTSELQSRFDLVCRLLLEKKNYRSL